MPFFYFYKENKKRAGTKTALDLIDSPETRNCCVITVAHLVEHQITILKAKGSIPFFLNQ